MTSERLHQAREDAECAAYDPDGTELRRLQAAKPKPSTTCPTCKRQNALSPAEARKGYQCRSCARREEGAY